MAKVKILSDFEVREGSFDGLDAQAFAAGSTLDVPDEAAANFIGKGLAEDASPKKQAKAEQ